MTTIEGEFSIHGYDGDEQDFKQELREFIEEREPNFAYASVKGAGRFIETYTKGGDDNGE